VKKVLAGVLSIILILAVMETTQLYASNNLTFSIGEIGSIAQGETIIVPIIVSNNPGFTSVGLVMTYDPNVLEIIDVIAQSAAMPLNTQFALTSVAGTQWIHFVNTNLVDWNGNGVIANVVFKVKATATIGSSAISLAFTSTPDGTPANANGDTLKNSVNASGNAVTVTNSSSGTTPTISENTQMYYLTVRASIGGKIITGSSGEYVGGSVISISASANSDYIFDSWDSTNGGIFLNFYSSSTSFTMPNSDTTIVAYFYPVDNYNIGNSIGNSNSTYNPSIGNNSTGQSVYPTPTQAPVSRPISGSTPANTPTPTPVLPLVTDVHVSPKDYQPLSMVSNHYLTFKGQQPMILYGMALVPVRETFEQLGCTVTWDQNSRTATIRGNNVVLHIQDGSWEYTVNGYIYSLGGYAQMVNGYFMVPFAKPLESMGYSAYLDGNNTIWAIK